MTTHESPHIAISILYCPYLTPSILEDLQQHILNIIDSYSGSGHVAGPQLLAGPVRMGDADCPARPGNHCAGAVWANPSSSSASLNISLPCNRA